MIPHQGPTPPVAPATTDRDEFAVALFRHLFPDAARRNEASARFGVRLADWVRPAGPVGGDVWGLIEIEDGALALYAFDCAGSGLEGAFDAFRMNGLITAINADRRNPGAMLSALNQHLRALLPSGRFVTMTYGVIADDGRFAYASAAAPPPIVVAGAETMVGNGVGLPLGLADTDYDTRSLALPEGATVMLHTDGLSNAIRSDGHRFGQDGMLKLATALGRSTTLETCQTRIEELCERAAPGLTGTITDDALLLLCRRTGDLRRPRTKAPSGPPTGLFEGHLRRSILVVDDDPLVRKVIVQSFQSLGYTPIEADDGHRALSLLESAEEPFDGILLDKNMPGISGLEVLRRIRALPRHAETPMVVLTGDDSPADREEGLKAGAYYYLSKPFHVPVAALLLEAAIGDRNRYRTLRQEQDGRALALSHLTLAEFKFRTVAGVRALAQLLGSLCPEPSEAAGGLFELMMNAVEHGNLGISYQEKSRLLLAGGFDTEVARRLALPSEADRYATVEVYRFPETIDFVIRDLGQGFDWRRYLDFDPERLTHLHGRGIAMARHCAFSEIQYRGNGNEVLARIHRAAEFIP